MKKYHIWCHLYDTIQRGQLTFSSGDCCEIAAMFSYNQHKCLEWCANIVYIASWQHSDIEITST